MSFFQLSPDWNTVPFRSIRQAMLHVTCLPKFWIRHMGEMTVTYIHIRQIFTIFLRFLKPFLRFLFMVSALGQNDRYNRYISAFLEWLLRVTAELIEMAQYTEIQWKSPVLVQFELVQCLVPGPITITNSLFRLGFLWDSRSHSRNKWCNGWHWV